jgi:hypothetical protein
MPETKQDLEEEVVRLRARVQELEGTNRRREKRVLKNLTRLGTFQSGQRMRVETS